SMNEITQAEEIETDPVFLGLTRPAMFWGVPQPYFVMNGMLSMLAFLWSGSFSPILVVAPLIHGVGYFACMRDLRIFEICKIKARFVRCVNAGYWKTRSYDPLR